jgi:hypothetical protein
MISVRDSACEGRSKENIAIAPQEKKKSFSWTSAERSGKREKIIESKHQ